MYAFEIFCTTPRPLPYIHQHLSFLPGWTAAEIGLSSVEKLDRGGKRENVMVLMNKISNLWWHNSWHSQIHIWPNLHFQRQHPQSRLLYHCLNTPSISTWSLGGSFNLKYHVSHFPVHWNTTHLSSPFSSLVLKWWHQFPFGVCFSLVSEFAYIHRAVCSD